MLFDQQWKYKIHVTWTSTLIVDRAEICPWKELVREQELGDRPGHGGTVSAYVCGVWTRCSAVTRVPRSRGRAHAMRRQERQLYTHIIMKVVASRTLQEYNLRHKRWVGSYFALWQLTCSSRPSFQHKSRSLWTLILWHTYWKYASSLLSRRNPKVKKSHLLAVYEKEH